MKKLILFPIFLFTIGLFSQSIKNPYLAAYKIADEWHIIDYSGNDVLKTSNVTEINSFTGGYFKVKIKNGKKEQPAFMKSDGTIIKITDCDIVTDFSEGFARIVKALDTSRINYKYGFIDSNLKIFEPFSFMDAGDYHEGLAYYRINNMRGYIDKSGNLAFNIDSLIGYDFSEGLVKVNNSKAQFGFIDRTGKLVIDLKFDDVGNFNEGLCYGNKVDKYGYFDKTGNFVIDPVYDYTNDFSDSLAFVGQINPKYQVSWGLIDYHGNTVSDFRFDKVRNFSDGMACVLKIDKWGFIDKSGQFVIMPRFTSAGNFVDGLAWAADNKSEKYGFINKSGEFVVNIPKPSKVIDLRENKPVY